MKHMTSFSELRSCLGMFGNSSSAVNLSEFLSYLNRLTKLRKSLFDLKPVKKPALVEPIEIIDHTVLVSTTVKEQPIEVTYAKPRTHITAAPSSISYNAERYLPYRVLWAKVIIRATYDYALWKDSPDIRLRTYAQDAERWLFESSDLELSFENICFAFDFPVEKIRQKTRTLTKNDVKKLEFRERQGRGSSLGDTDGNSR